MNENVREKFVVAIQKSLRVVGAKDYESGMESAEKLLGWAHNGIQSIRTTDDLRAALDSVPPLTKREEAIALFLMNQLPQVIRMGLKIAAKKAAFTLPALQTGRPPAIPARKSGEVLNYIALLHRKGCTLDAAQMRSARKFGCSLRTIERLWSKRESVEDEDEIVEVTMDDALNYLSKGQ